MLKYLKNTPDFLIKSKALSINNPKSRNGNPKPNEYANNKRKDNAGCAIARAKTPPKITPTQGVHPTAKAAPKINEVRY